DAEGARCLIASHLAPAPGDVEIKLPPDGLVERRDGRDAVLEIGRAHATNLHLSVRGESSIARRLALWASARARPCQLSVPHYEPRGHPAIRPPRLGHHPRHRLGR